jgi:hypothetical protein
MGERWREQNWQSISQWCPAATEGRQPVVTKVQIN